MVMKYKTIVATKFAGITSIHLIDSSDTKDREIQTQDIVFDFLKQSAGMDSIGCARFRTNEYNSIYGVTITGWFGDEEYSRVLGVAHNDTLSHSLNVGDNRMSIKKAKNIIGVLTVEGTLSHKESELARRGRTLADVPVIAVINLITVNGKTGIDTIVTNDPVFTAIKSNRHNRILKDSTAKCLFNDCYSINKFVKPLYEGLSVRNECYDSPFTASALYSLDGSEINLADDERTNYSILIDDDFTTMLSEQVGRKFDKSLGIEEYIAA